MSVSVVRAPAFRFGLYVAFLLLVGFGCLMVDMLRLPLIFSVLFSYALAPFVNRIESRGIERGLAVLVIYAVVGVILAAMTWSLSPWVVVGYRNIERNLQGALTKSQTAIEKVLTNLEDKMSLMTPSLLGGASTRPATQPAASSPASQAASQSAIEEESAEVIAARRETRRQLIVRGTTLIEDTVGPIIKAIPGIVPDILVTLILLPVFSYFMIRDAGAIRRQIVRPIPNRYFEISLGVLHLVNQQVGAYIRARLIQSFLVGTIVWAGLSMLGFNYALFHAVFAAILNLVPYVGPIIAAIPALIILLIDPHTPLEITLVMGVFVVGQIIDGVIIVPGVMSRIIDMHPIWLIVVTTAGGQVYGAMGMIISVPLFSVAKIVVTETVRGFSSLK